MPNQHSHNESSRADKIHAFLVSAPLSTRASIASALGLSSRQCGSALTNLADRNRVAVNHAMELLRYTALAPVVKSAPVPDPTMAKIDVVREWLKDNPNSGRKTVAKHTGLALLQAGSALTNLAARGEAAVTSVIGNIHYYSAVTPKKALKIGRLTGASVIIEEEEVEVREKVEAELSRLHLTADELQDIAIARIRAARKIPTIFLSPRPTLEV